MAVCILHMEMRVNEKTFWTFFAMPLHRHPDCDAAAGRKLTEAVTEECMRTAILGDNVKGRVSQ